MTAASPDGKLFACKIARCTLRLFSFTGDRLRRRTTIATQLTESPTALTFTSDGNILALVENRLSKWDTNGKKLLSMDLPGLRKEYYTICALSPDGGKIAIDSNNKVLKVWDIRKGRSVWKGAKSSNIINSIAFSRDGNSLLVGSSDTVKGEERSYQLINLTKGQPITIWGSGLNAGFTPDGNYILVNRNDSLLDKSDSAILLDLTGRRIDGFPLPEREETNNSSTVFRLEGAILLSGPSSQLFQRVQRAFL